MLMGANDNNEARLCLSPRNRFRLPVEALCNLFLAIAQAIQAFVFFDN